MSQPLSALRRAAAHRKALAASFPWTTEPLLTGAPMRAISGPAMALSIACAGGLGFLGPGAEAESTDVDLDDVRVQLTQSTDTCTQTLAARASPFLPVGVGFQVWNSNLDVAEAVVQRYRPCVVWLFAPRDGQAELDVWTLRMRAASPGTHIWLQVGTLQEALDAASRTPSPSRAVGALPDALVLQGSEAGGHGRTSDGIGLITLLPEVADALGDEKTFCNMPLLAAGGIVDGRGAAASFSLGAAGVVMGSRFLATTEARIAPAYQAEVIRATDGAKNTGRTQLYNHLRGTFSWPASWSPRGLRNQSEVDEAAGLSFDQLKERHDMAVKEGGRAAWGLHGRVATYVGASVGLIREVKGAAEVVAETRAEMEAIKLL